MSCRGSKEPKRFQRELKASVNSARSIRLALLYAFGDLKQRVASKCLIIFKLVISTQDDFHSSGLIRWALRCSHVCYSIAVFAIIISDSCRPSPQNISETLFQLPSLLKEQREFLLVSDLFCSLSNCSVLQYFDIVMKFIKVIPHVLTFMSIRMF